MDSLKKTPATPPRSRQPSSQPASEPARRASGERKDTGSSLGPSSLPSTSGPADPARTVRTRQAAARRLDFTSSSDGPGRFELQVAAALAGALRGTVTPVTLGVGLAAAFTAEPDPAQARLDPLWGHYRARASQLSPEHLRELALTVGAHLLLVHADASAAMARGVDELIRPVAAYLSDRQRGALLAGLDGACTGLAALPDTRSEEIEAARSLLASHAPPEAESVRSAPASLRDGAAPGSPVRSPTRKALSRPGALDSLIKRSPADVLMVPGLSPARRLFLLDEALRRDPALDSQRIRQQFNRIASIGSPAEQPRALLTVLALGVRQLEQGSLDARQLSPEVFEQLTAGALLKVSTYCNEEVDAAVTESKQAEWLVRSKFESTDQDLLIETKTAPPRRAAVVLERDLRAIDATLRADQQVAIDRAVDGMLRYYGWFAQSDTLDKGREPGRVSPGQRPFVARQVDALRQLAPQWPAEHAVVVLAVAAALEQALGR